CSSSRAPSARCLRRSSLRRRPTPTRSRSTKTSTRRSPPSRISCSIRWSMPRRPPPPTRRASTTSCSSSTGPTFFTGARTSRPMSKMSSSKSGAFLALAFVLLSGCGPNVHSSSIRGIGYVRVADVVKHHPLYPQLSQLDDAITAIQLKASTPHVPLSASQIAAQTKELNGEMQAANDRANKILTQKQQTYLKREQQAIAAALTAANVPGAGEYASRLMSTTSAQQAQQAAQAAGQDFLAYQKSVVEQNRAAAASIVHQLQAQAQQKYRAKAEQLGQQETDLSMRLSQQDAQQRLAIKTRLNNLALDAATHKQLQDQLAAIDSREAAQTNAMRKADQATLDAYRKQLNDQTNKQMQAQLSTIQSQTQSKIEERRNEVGNQIRSLAP